MIPKIGSQVLSQLILCKYNFNYFTDKMDYFRKVLDGFQDYPKRALRIVRTSFSWYSSFFTPKSPPSIPSVGIGVIFNFDRLLVPLTNWATGFSGESKLSDEVIV